MAELLDVSNVGAQASQAASQGYTLFLWTILLMVVIGGLIFWLYTMSFNWKVRLRYQTGTKDLLKDTRGKIKKDNKDGVSKFIYWKNLLSREYVPVPPPDAVDLQQGGKKSVELEISENGSSRWIYKDKTTYSFKPLDTNDRVFFINEWRKKEARKKQSLGELVLLLTPFLAIIIILSLMFAFWGDIVAPLNEANDKINKRMEIEAEIVSDLKQIIKQEQILVGEGEELDVVETPPE